MLTPKTIRDKDTWALIYKNATFLCARSSVRQYNKALFDAGAYKIEVNHRYMSMASRTSVYIHVPKMLRMHFYYRGPIDGTKNYETHNIHITKWSLVGKTTIEDIEHMMVILKLTRGN